MIGAVIDIGSNSVRLLVAEGVNSPQPLLKRVTTTRLGEGEGKLNYDSMAKTIAAISSYVEQVKGFGDVPIAAFATGAVREASNQQRLLDSIMQSTGIAVDVVDGQTEAMLSLLGACSGEGALIDIGGSTTEVIYGKNGKVIYTESFPVGCVRAKKHIDEEMLYEDVEPFFRYLDERMDLKAISSKKWYGVGGTITTLAALKKNMTKYDPDKIHQSVLKSDDIPELLKKIRRKDLRKQLPILGPREDIILYGALILGYMMAFMDIDMLTVSEADNMEGYWKAVFAAQ